MGLQTLSQYFYFILANVYPPEIFYGHLLFVCNALEPVNHIRFISIERFETKSN